jgi:hypothetical protein
MPERETIERAKADKKSGKSASTQAGEFIREEMHHIREGKHGARSTKQAIAIGLSKARRAGVKVGASKKAPKRVRRQAQKELARGKKRTKANPRRARAARRALRGESRAAASKENLSKQAKSTAKKRGPAARSKSAKKAAATRKRSKRAAA